MKLKVVILVGGSSMEREVSFCSAENVLKNIDSGKYNIKVIELPKNEDSIWVKQLIDFKPNIVLSALHGGIGENGAVQGLMKCLRIPFIGSSVISSAICMDKSVSKTIMRANHIPVVDGIFVRRDDNILEYEERFKEIGYPLIVKPNRGGSSIGINIVHNYQDVIKAIDDINKYNDDIIIEKFIVGREVTCSVLQTKSGIEVLPVLDIMTENQFYDYNAKYIDNQTKIDFSTLPEYLKVMIEEIAKKVFKIMKCKGYACVDMIIDEEQIYVIEINTLPGLTKHSLIPKAVKYLNISFDEFISELIDFEIENFNKKDEK